MPTSVLSHPGYVTWYLFSLVYLFSSFKFSMFILYISIIISVCMRDRERQRKQRICVHAVMFIQTSEDNWWGLIFSFLCMGPRIHTQVLSLESKRLYLLSPIYGPTLFFLFIKTRTPDFRVFFFFECFSEPHKVYSTEYSICGRWQMLLLGSSEYILKYVFIPRQFFCLIEPYNTLNQFIEITISQ